MAETQIARWQGQVASCLKITNVLIREGLAECLGTFLLVVSNKIPLIVVSSTTPQTVAYSYTGICFLIHSVSENKVGFNLLCIY